MRKQTQLLINIAFTALMAALITLFTAYIGHIPLPGTAGYLHFGDSLIYLAACLLPRPYAMAAGAIGGGLSDLLTYPAYTIPTVIIKALITLPFTSKQPKLLGTRNAIAPLPAYVISAVGYFLAESILYGWGVAFISSVLGSLVQSGGSAVIFLALAAALDRLKIKEKFLTMNKGQ